MELSFAMSRISSLVLFLAACLQAQTTVYLRYGEPGSFSKITGCTNATPVVCTTSTAHGFSNGDLVWIQSVYGNWAANGLRKVASATPTTFALTTTADVNVAGNGAYAHNGIVGRVQPYTIKGHPRMMLDGPGGAWTTAVQGRDQTGYPPYDALKKVADSPGALTHPDRAGPVAYMSALGWHMDSSKTAWLNQAKSIMNNVQNVLISGTTGERFPGLFTASTYGRGSDVDWASHTAVPYAYTYSLIRSQMTSEERTAFLDKMLNNSTDYGESCTQPIQWRTAGRLSTTSGSKIITGTDTDFTTITPGTHIAVLRPNGALYNIPVNWYTVASVQSSNSLTVTASVGFTTSGAMIGVARPWQAGDCGWRWYNRNYGYSGMWDKRVMQFSLVSAIGPSDTTMTVTLAPPKPVPYFAGVDVLVDGVYRTEVVKVTGVNGNTLTVERGQLNTTPLSVPTARVWNVGEPTEVLTPTITRYNPPIETIPYDDPRHNLVITKAFGFIMVGLALADDDPRAAEMFQGAWNY